MLFSLTFFSFSQEEKKVNSIYKKGEQICNEYKKKLFCKAFSFFKNRQYDSCYVYSNKALLGSVKNKEKDYLYYISGYSSYKKRLYNKALDDFSLISNKKDYELKNYL